MADSFSQPTWTLPQAAHLLNRAGFGGTPETIEKLHRLGREAAVESLLAVDDDADLFPPPALSSAQEIYAYRQEIKPLPDGPARRELSKAFRLRQNQELRDIREWWLRRCRYGAFPLREKMTLFWHGHFATSVEKVNLTLLMWRQNETLRDYALGSFRQMTEEIARDPAMMRYLDLDKNSKGKPNENFARELMELFTLGEGVCYTEKDVQESARAMTGCRINPKTFHYIFAKKQFDDSSKTVLGQEGNFKGVDVINIICARRECAAFLRGKIWDFLAGVPASPGLAAQLAERYQKSDYNTAALLREIFLSDEFYAPTVMRHQVKSPIQWLVQTSIVLDAPLCAPETNERLMRQMGQMLFAPPNVRGWLGGQSWVNSSTFLLRCNVAGEMIHGRSKGVESVSKMSALPIDWSQLAPDELRSKPDQLVDAFAFRFLNSPLAPDDRKRFISFVTEHGTDDEGIRDLAHLFLSKPEYQLT